ncbi:MAG TPA: heparinase II/III family protein, partial [Actinopolymorphaceae bacterium]|nr:heparinase II/III family protein [Actinopolymorphaceae bacterium]
RAVGRSRLYGLHYLGWMTPLVHAYALSKDDSFATTFADHVDRWYDSRERVRGEWPGLDVIWYSLGVASRGSVMVRALLEFADQPGVADRTWLRMLATVVGGARWLAEKHAAFRHGNWQFSACCSLLEVAALLPEHEEAEQWLDVARARIEDHLRLDVYSDGGHYERAPSYHTLCLDAVQNAAVIAEQSLDWPLAAEPAFAAMHDWLVDMATPTGWVPPFNDSHIVWAGDYLVVGHYLLDRPDYKALVERWVDTSRVRSLLAWLPARPGRRAPFTEYLDAPTATVEPARSRWLAGSRYAVHRTGWGSDDLHLAVNCGPMVAHELESHSHRTALDFVLAGYDAPLAWEAGGPANYDDAAYYEWYQATRAHNTVLVPGRTLGDNHEARLETFLACPEIDVLSATHDGWGTRHRRMLVLVHADGSAPYLLVDDQVADVDGFGWAVHARTPWRSCGPDHHRTTGAPGLLVVGDPTAGLATTRHDEGVACYPDRDGDSRRYEPLHALVREFAGQRARTVVVPFRDRPSQVEVTEGADLTVRIDDHDDRFGDRWWLRSRHGEPVAAAAWSLDPDGPQPNLPVGGTGITAVSATWQPTCVVVTAEASGRGLVRVYAPGVQQASVSGVVVPVSVDGAEVIVDLPSAGRWEVRVERTMR